MNAQFLAMSPPSEESTPYYMALFVPTVDHYWEGEMKQSQGGTS